MKSRHTAAPSWRVPVGQVLRWVFDDPPYSLDLRRHIPLPPVDTIFMSSWSRADYNGLQRRGGLRCQMEPQADGRKGGGGEGGSRARKVDKEYRK